MSKYEPRPYQTRALNLARKLIIEGCKRLLFQSPTGSGKGVILSHIINGAAARGRTVLFLIHRTEILLQVSAYMDHYEIPHGIIKAGFKAEMFHPVQLASFQTLSRRMKVAVNLPDKFDIVIVDEAHHSLAKTYLEVIDRFFEKLLIGLTATPCRGDGRGLGDLFDQMIQVATIQELTDLGFLAPVRYFAPVEPDLSEVKITAGDYNAKQLEAKMLEKGLVGGIVPFWLENGERRKTMVFATGVAHSLAIRDEFLAAGVSAAHVDGNTPVEERDEIMRWFKEGSIEVLCNCMLYTEGVDVPDISCVIIARPSKSLPMYMQMVGRGMRVIEGKEDMLLFDHAGIVYEHGYVHEITDWELDPKKKTVNKANEKRKKRDSRPIACPKCSHLYQGQLRCPRCGNVPEVTQFARDVEYIDGKLGELVLGTKKAKIKTYSMEEKRSWYGQLAGLAKERGKGDSWVNAMYRSKFGVWPQNTQCDPTECSREVRSYVTSRQIAFAKGAQSGNAKAA